MGFLRRFGGGLALAALFCGCSRDDGDRVFSTLSELEAAGALVGCEEGTCAERLAVERLKGCRFMQTIGPTMLYPAVNRRADFDIMEGKCWRESSVVIPRG